MNPSQESSAGSAAAAGSQPAAESPVAEAASGTTPASEGSDGSAPGPHNFEIQKELHQRIRNDPDYDDWEYGTEPLPHEQQGWISRPTPAEASEAAGSTGVGVDAG